MTIMIVLLESNSLKLPPISFIDVIDGASSGAIGAEWSSPTTSSCGAITFTTTATNTQNRTIGTARMRSVCGKTGRLGCSSVSAGAIACVMRTSPGSRSGR